LNTGRLELLLYGTKSLQREFNCSAAGGRQEKAQNLAAKVYNGARFGRSMQPFIAVIFR